MHAGEFGPGEVLHVDVDLTTHTCEVLNSSFETTACHKQLILKNIVWPYRSGSRNMAFFSARLNLRCVVFSFVLRAVTVLLGICSKLAKYNIFLNVLDVHSEINFDGQWHCKDALPSISFSTINLCFGPSYHLTKFGHGEFFRTLS